MEESAFTFDWDVLGPSVNKIQNIVTKDMHLSVGQALVLFTGLLTLTLDQVNPDLRMSTAEGIDATIKKHLKKRMT